ncbi:MAG: molybdopterin converting factor subunit 1 [Devosiaceae bacterium]|nr:molybdopterin converting factor subunit 1 [Devosiaceae bacterium]
MKILYFAWLRERLNRGEEEVSPPSSVKTIADLIEWKSQTDEGFALAFAKRSLIKSALNENIVSHDTPLDDAKIIAFFPPMTGG